MQLNSTSKDSSGQSVSKNGQKSKITLFYKPSILKVYSLFILFSLLVGAPSVASADFFDFLTGSASASENASGTESSSLNSQTMPLIESSINPDMKNMDDSVYIPMEDDSVGTDWVGSGLESDSNGEIVTYTVKKGDTLSQIAEDYDVSVNTIRWENGLSGQTVKEGQELRILPVTGVKHIVKSGDTIAKIANKYDADSDEISIYNGISDGTIKAGDVIIVPNGVIVNTPSKSTSSSSSSGNSKSAPVGYYLRPASGRITSPYGSRKGGFHYGVDIGNARGTPVYAAASGKVIAVVSYCKEGATSCGGRYGNYIVIEHANGQRTRYAHLSKVNVSVGQSVKQGKQIGAIGNTGRSTGPHLHFQVEKQNGATVRPVF